MKYENILMALVLMALVALPAMAATNSYAFVRSTDAELSTGAVYETVTISSNQIAMTSTSVGVGRYAGAVQSVPNMTTGAMTVSSYTTTGDLIDYGWLYSNTLWLNSTDGRETVNGHAYYSIRYSFDKIYSNTIKDYWYTYNDASSYDDGTCGSTTTIGVASASYPASNYLQLDGVNTDYVNTGYSFNYTAGYWVQGAMIYTTGVAGSPIGISDADSNAVIELQLVDSGSNDYWKILIRDHDGTTKEIYDAAKIVSASAWHYVYMRADGTTLYLYMDGVLQASGTFKPDASSQLTLDYIELGGIYYGGNHIASFTGRIDEYRWRQGAETVGANVHQTTSKWGTYMSRAVGTSAYNYNYYPATYNIPGSGNIFTLITMYTESAIYVTDYTNTIRNTAPTATSYTPATGTYMAPSSVTLRLYAHDADISYVTPTDVEFFLDGVSKGHVTNATDGYIKKDVGLIPIGNHNWTAIVYDPWSGSYNTGLRTFTITGNMTIYDEEHYTTPLTGETITVNFFTTNTSVTKTTTTGVVGLTGLPSGNMLVTAQADGFLTRKTIVTSIFETPDMYLINESSDYIYNTFELNTQTLEFPASDYIIRVQKPMNGSTPTVFCSYFDFDAKCGTYLLANDVYRLVIEGPDGSQTDYGWLYPDPDGIIEISLPTLQYTDFYNSWLSYNYSVDRDAREVTFSYNSTSPVASATMLVEVDNTTVYNATVTDDVYSFIYVAGANVDLDVTVTIVSADGTFTNKQYTSFIDNHINIFPSSYPMWLRLIIVTMITLTIMLGFGAWRADIAAALGVGWFSFCVYQEAIEVNPLTVSIMVICVLGAIVKHQRRKKRM